MNLPNIGAALAFVCLPAWGAGGFPIYSANSIANSAVGILDFYAPNMFLSIYGENLSRVTRAISADDIAAGQLPTVLIGTGVRVLINHLPADIWYVSPTLVNLLVPTSVTEGPATVQLVADGLAGPEVTILLGATAPSLFQIDAVTVLGVHLDASVITVASPAKADEVVVLFATGLGLTVPSAVPHQVAAGAARLIESDFQILLDGVAVDRTAIEYVGVGPGYAGLYQINLKLPGDVGVNPEIRLISGGRVSPGGRYLRVR